jgi:diguanylate cyclase (GGDEF)-like protein
MERFRTAVQSARRRGHSLSFAFCDLDNFKGINDRYGHAAGDQAIKAVAAALQQGVRCDDLVARYGGDEFCMMFAHSTAQQAAEAIERIRQTVAALQIESGDERFSITITVGVAALAPGEDGVETLMEAADRAMYFAKLAGRNQVQVAAVDASM